MAILSRADRLRRMKAQSKTTQTPTPKEEAPKKEVISEPKSEQETKPVIQETPKVENTETPEPKKVEEHVKEPVKEAPKAVEPKKTEIKEKISTHEAEGSPKEPEKKAAKPKAAESSNNEEVETPRPRRRGRPKGTKNKATVEAEKKAEKKAAKAATQKAESTSKRSRASATKPAKSEMSESKSSSEDGEPARVITRPRRRGALFLNTIRKQQEIQEEVPPYAEAVSEPEESVVTTEVEEASVPVETVVSEESKEKEVSQEASMVSKRPSRFRGRVRKFGAINNAASQEDFHDFQGEGDSAEKETPVEELSDTPQIVEEEVSIEVESVETQKEENHQEKPVSSPQRTMGSRPRRFARTTLYKNPVSAERKAKEQDEGRDNSSEKDVELYPQDKQPSGYSRNRNSSDVVIIIKPFSTVPFVDGEVPSKAHQETSNMRFTEHDQIAAKESGLSWD